jgi:hypothetical protein
MQAEIKESLPVCGKMRECELGEMARQRTIDAILQ